MTFKLILLITFSLGPLWYFTSSSQVMSNEAMYKKGVDTSKYVPTGLVVGEPAPPINTASINREEISSMEILQSKNLVVLFYRGKWCPVCRKHLSHIRDSLQIIRDAGAEVVVIGPETFEYTREMDDKYDSEFILIPDTTLTLLKAFDVLFYVTPEYQNKVNLFIKEQIADRNNQEEAMLPVPATYIIGKDGRIKWRHFDYNYSNRASATQIFRALQELN